MFTQEICGSQVSAALWFQTLQVADSIPARSLWCECEGRAQRRGILV